MTETLNIMRHESVFNPAEHKYPIHIIGAGATGSRVFASIIELGMTDIHVYDPDTVEDHNLANQIYMASDVGKSKVDGCAAFARNKLGIDQLPDTMHFHRRPVTGAYIAEGGVLGGIVFILTDTMESRKTIFNALINRISRITTTSSDSVLASRMPLLIIETRMGSTHGSVFTINPFDKTACDAWLTTLVDDTDEDNIELSPCGTTLSVGTTAALIANYAVWQMMQFFVDPLSLQPRLDFFFKPTLTIPSPAIAA